MFEYVYEWIVELAGYMVLVTVFLHIIPNPDYRKYIRFFTGLVLILLVLTPILGMFGTTIQLQELRESDIYEEAVKRMEEIERQTAAKEVKKGDAAQVDLRKFCQPVADALRSLGADACVSGRNDIFIGEQKVSGNAQYIRDGRVMHHGTLLFDSDLSILSNALNVDPAKIKAKGIRSVRSHVTTIRPHLGQPISLSDFKSLLLKHLFPGGVK